MSVEVDVFLDVDGVLNAVSVRDPRDSWGEWRTTKCCGFLIKYAPEMVARLNALAELPNVHFHWLTTWKADAARVISPAIGINGQSWPVLGAEVGDDLSGAGSDWWKLRALLAFWPTRTGVGFWVDDDLAIERRARDWLAGQTSLSAIAPAVHRGLTPADIALIERAARA